MATIDIEMASPLLMFEPNLALAVLGTEDYFPSSPVHVAGGSDVGDILFITTAPGNRTGLARIGGAFEMPAWTTFDDIDGDGEEDGPIVVTGERENELDNPPPPPGDPGPGWGGGGGGGPYQPVSEEPDCRDTQAVAAKNEINGRSDDDTREIGKLTYRTASGLQSSPVILGSGAVITWDRILEAISANNIDINDIVAFTHNHDKEHYATGQSSAERNANRDLNRYPSNNDWNFARELVELGAGTNGGGFALYIIDTEGHMREFDYRDRHHYRNMSDDDRIDGEDLPPETVAGACGQ